MGESRTGFTAADVDDRMGFSSFADMVSSTVEDVATEDHGEERLEMFFLSAFCHYSDKTTLCPSAPTIYYLSAFSEIESKQTIF